MSLGIVAGTANPILAEAVASRLGTRVVEMQLERFPDGEIRPCLGPIRGADVYVVQPTGPPVNDNLVELLLLLDACRRAGADRVTAVVPYFGYARQDRRSGDRRPIGARVAAEAIASAGAGRLVVVDPHTSSLEAMFGVPVLTAVPVLASAVRQLIPDRAVVVAPDLGAMRLARHFASLVQARLAAVSKYLLDAVTVSGKDIVGDVRNRPVVIVDDMISLGATIEAAVNALRAHGAAGEPIVVATHGLFAGTALAGLSGCDRPDDGHRHHRAQFICVAQRTRASCQRGADCGAARGGDRASVPQRAAGRTAPASMTDSDRSAAPAWALGAAMHQDRRPGRQPRVAAWMAARTAGPVQSCSPASGPGRSDVPQPENHTRR